MNDPTFGGILIPLCGGMGVELRNPTFKDLLRDMGTEQIRKGGDVMGMSTRVVGIRDPDERWVKMKAVWDSCKRAGVEVPGQVEDYFNDVSPDTGVVVPLDYGEFDVAVPWADASSSREGVEITLSRLPVGVTKIRFYNSW